MKIKILILITTIFIASCSDKKKRADSDEISQSDDTKSNSVVNEIEKKPKGSSNDNEFGKSPKTKNSNEKVVPLNINDIDSLQGSVWIFEPFENCVDTLSFKNLSNGYLYSCEHYLNDSITYSIDNDTLIIEKWEFVSQVDAALGKEIKSKYFMKLMDNSLIMLDIQRKYKDNFESVDEKYLGQVYRLLKRSDFGGKEIQIEPFDEWPSEVEGCSCYSSINKDEFEKKKFIYIDDYGDKAFMNLNGKIEMFDLLTTDTLSSYKNSIKTWSNEKYQIIIETKQIGQIDETWQHQGKLIITSNNQKEIEIKIYGECGC